MRRTALSLPATHTLFPAPVSWFPEELARIVAATRPDLGLMRMTVPSVGLLTQTAPPAMAIPPPRPLTETVAVTRPAAGSIRLTVPS